MQYNTKRFMQRQYFLLHCFIELLHLLNVLRNVTFYSFTIYVNGAAIKKVRMLKSILHNVFIRQVSWSKYDKLLILVYVCENSVYLWNSTLLVNVTRMLPVR